MDASLLVLYGSQTGNAQDVAERIGREARLRLFAPRVLAMDSYDVSRLPAEPLVVFVASTTGQGDPPDNMRRFWKFLLRKSLAADSLARCRYAVFGLGDSGYPNYNVTAKKLDRRLQGLGAGQLLALGLGDDQHPNGYEAALDPWVTRLWTALRAAFPLPANVPEPVLSEDALLALGPPKFRMSYLSAAEAAAATEALAARLQAEQPHVVGLAEQVRQPAAAAAAAAAATGVEASRRLAEAAAAAADFRRLMLHAAGADAGPSPPPAEHPPQQPSSSVPYTYGPWRPYLARVLVNRRVTAPEHFQDTRHIELDLGGSSLSYDPGDAIAVLPMTSDAVVTAFLERLGLEGEAWVRVEAAEEAEGEERGGPGANGVVAAGAVSTHGSAAAPCVVARVRSLVQGCLDIGGASPRRYFFQMLRHFTEVELERDRLSYFATAEGRDDLYRYNNREGRTVLEVLCDFRSASPPLERLLEAAPHLRPRLYSAASSQRLRGRSTTHLLVALVSYRTPHRRLKTGLCSAYWARLGPTEPAAPTAAAAVAGVETSRATADEGADPGPLHPSAPAPAPSEAPLVAVWTERGSLRLPRSPDTPLILVGPGTGVAPFRAFLEDRYALLLLLEGRGRGEREAEGGTQQHHQQQPPRPPPPQTPQANGAPCQPQAHPQRGDQAAAAANTPPPPPPPPPSTTTTTTMTPVPAPCYLFFGCRGPSLDFYYREQWEEYCRAGVLDRGTGLITAFSREVPEAAALAPPPPPGTSGGGGGKVYVTQRIREQGELLWRLLSDRGAAVFVSGSAKRMPEGVAAAFADVAAAHGGMEPAAAAAFIRQLELKGRYQVEAWS